MNSPAAASTGPSPRSSGAAWIVILAGVSAALHVGKLPPAIPALQAELGLTLVQAGFLLSLVQLATMALGIVAGLLADGIGLRRCVLIGLCVLVLAGAAGGFMHSATGLLVLRAVEGVGVLLVTVPAPSLVRRNVPPSQLTRMLGFWGAFMPFGTATALLLGPAVIPWGGWPGWWWLVSAFSLVMAIWVWRAVPADARASTGAPGGAGVPWPARLRSTVASVGPWLGALTFAVYSAQWLAVIGFLPSLYQQAGWGGARGAVLTAGVAGVNIIGNVLAGRLLARGVPAQRLLWAGFGAMALGAVLAFSDLTAGSAVLRYAGALLFSAIGGLIPGTLFGLAPRLAPGEHSIATTVGLMQQLSAVGQVGGPPLAAWLAGQVGGWQLTWAMTGACCVAGALLAALIGQRLRRS
ncbi:MFS transporter [Ottowia sp. GY511]|uniref:CynX/NimT family MFS transporter n=1 Tax=Ottowia flava TaxID=2675430 RepID=A0ABW4KVF7_9BURK|nr:MFS transporter [Ottowia sp. GY511]TXK31388.1 MFS transporter [Ottowia sp. GY511]